MKKCKRFDVDNKIVFVFVDDYNNTKIMISNIVVSDKALETLPYYTGDLCKYYRNYVSHKLIVSEKKYSEITEKYIKQLIKKELK